MHNIKVVLKYILGCILTLQYMFTPSFLSLETVKIRRHGVLQDSRYYFTTSITSYTSGAPVFITPTFYSHISSFYWVRVDCVLKIVVCSFVPFLSFFISFFVLPVFTFNLRFLITAFVSSNLSEVRHVVILNI